LSPSGHRVGRVFLAVLAMSSFQPSNSLAMSSFQTKRAPDLIRGERDLEPSVKLPKAQKGFCVFDESFAGFQLAFELRSHLAGMTMSRGDLGEAIKWVRHDA